MNTTTAPTVISFVDCSAQNDDLTKPITISFTISGVLPQHFKTLLESPFTFSVTFPDEQITITTPTLKAGSIAEINATNRFSRKHDIPFIPLPADFNHEDRTQWMVLADSIQDWLAAEESLVQGNELWKWGTEAFWVAFTAAYPAFPHGEWPRWNPKINMEGKYIESWLENLSDDDDLEADGLSNEVWELGVVWQHFQQLLSGVPKL